MRRVVGSTLAVVLALSTLTTATAATQAAPSTTPSTQATTETANGFAPVSPRRVLDTRIGPGPIGAGTTVTVDLSSAVPATTTAVVVNITGVAPTTSTFVTAYPSGTTRPVASNLNLAAGETRANLATVALGADRRIMLFNKNGSVHLVADLTGYYAPTAPGRYAAPGPHRVMDTRTDFEGRPAAAIGPGAVTTLDLTRKVPASATAVTVNLTATGATTSTFVTAWPSGTARPVSSNVNVVRGVTTPNQAVVALGANRKIDLYNKNGSVHVVVDVTGYYQPDLGALFTPVAPRRVLDTRSGPPVASGDAVDVHLSKVVPSATTAVVMNVTGTQPTASTVVTAWSRHDLLPEVSTLNLARGQTAANLATSGVGDNLTVSLHNHSGSVHLIADLAGYFALPPFECTEGCVYAWGDNAMGRLGTGTYQPTAPSPAPVYGLSGVVDVSDGYALKADGTVWAWGGNQDSRLGNGWFGYVTKSPIPVPVVGLTDVVAIDRSIALKRDGTVWAWSTAPGGGNDVAAQVAGLTDVIAVDAGYGYAYALKRDGTVWSTGHPGTGPVQVPGPTGVRQIAVGWYNAYALDGDGRVWAWGDNGRGQLGNGTVGQNCEIPSSDPRCWNDEPHPVVGLTDVVAIGADLEHGYAVKADGTAWSWGGNYHGGLGSGLDCETCATGTPVRVTGLTNVRAIAGHHYGGYALDADGRVWAWGNNEQHALGVTEGVQPGAYSTVPLRLTSPTGVTDLAAEFGAGFALVP